MEISIHMKKKETNDQIPQTKVLQCPQRDTKARIKKTVRKAMGPHANQSVFQLFESRDGMMSCVVLCPRHKNCKLDRKGSWRIELELL